MIRALQDANNRERKSTDGESRFLRTKTCRPLPLKGPGTVIETGQEDIRQAAFK